jgi:hypothetical protein
MDGIRLAAAVRHRWPPIRLVVVSGHVTGESEPPPGLISSASLTSPKK